MEDKYDSIRKSQSGLILRNYKPDDCACNEKADKKIRQT